MEPNLQYLKQFVEREVADKYLSFSLENGKLIAEFIHFKLAEFLDIREYLKLYTDGHSFLLFYCPDDMGLPDDETDSPVYYQFDDFEDLGPVVDELLTKCDENWPATYRYYLANDALPAWALLKPGYIHEDHVQLFKKPLMDVIQSPDIRETLSNDQVSMIHRWLNFRKNEAGLYYAYVGGV